MKKKKIDQILKEFDVYANSMEGKILLLQEYSNPRKRQKQGIGKDKYQAARQEFFDLLYRFTIVNTLMRKSFFFRKKYARMNKAIQKHLQVKK